MTDHIGDYLAWLNRRASSRTVRERGYVLRLADRELTWGLFEATEAEISAWFDRHEAPWTRATYDNHLRQCLTWAAQDGRTTYNAMFELPRPPDGDRTPHPCEDWELALALTAPAVPWRRAVMLAAYAGLRCMEICSVTTSDVIHGRLRVLGKGRKYRVVPLGPELAAEIADTGPGHLCVGARGRPLAPNVLSQMQRPVWAALGLGEHITLHAFRHWFATRLIDTGADIRVVQTLLGHASVSTTQGYTAVTDPRLAAAVSRLPRVTVEPVDGRLGGLRAA